MPRLSLHDCEELLRAAEHAASLTDSAKRVMERLRQRVEQLRETRPSSPSPRAEKRAKRKKPRPEPLCTLHICTSCRAADTPREPREARPGNLLYQKLRAKVEEVGLSAIVNVAPAECLSICPRPCGIALSSPGSWTYLFGDQTPLESGDDILRCIRLYLSSADGLMPREQRPKSLQGSILGRIPVEKKVSSHHDEQTKSLNG